MQEQPQHEEYDWWGDYKEEEYSPQEWADHYQSVYETKADSVQREANVIKKHLGNIKKKTFSNSRSTAVDIASFIQEDVVTYKEREANITARGEDLVAQARKNVHEVLMTETFSWREGMHEVMITDAATDVGLLVADTACDKTVGTRYYLDRYEKQVLEPQGLRSVSQPEEEIYRFGPGEPKV